MLIYTIGMNRKLFLLTALVLSTALAAQTEHIDTIPTVRIGYVSGSLNTLAGAVDKVTEDRMNKGLIISSLGTCQGYHLVDRWQRPSGHY